MQRWASGFTLAFASSSDFKGFDWGVEGAKAGLWAWKKPRRVKIHGLQDKGTTRRCFFWAPSGIQHVFEALVHLGERTPTALALLWAGPCLASCFLLHSVALRAFPRSGEGREACHAEGCTHGNLCSSLKAWAVLTFHPDGSHQAPEVEAGRFSKAEVHKLCGDEWDGSTSLEGVCGKQKTPADTFGRCWKCGFLQ